MPYNIKVPANEKQCLRRKSLTDTSDSGNANHRSDVVRYDPAHAIISPQSSLPTEIRSPSSLGISAQAILPYLKKITEADSEASKFNEEKWNQYSGLVAKYLRQMQHREMSLGLAYMLNMSENSRLSPEDRAKALEASLNQDGGTFKKFSPAWYRRQEIFQEIDLLKAARDKNAAVGDQQKHASISYAGLEDDRTPPNYVRAYMAIVAPNDDGSFKDIYLDQNGEWVTQSPMLWIGLGTPHRALSWFMKYHLENKDLNKKGPLIRSFLVNKQFLRDHLGKIETEKTREKTEETQKKLEKTRKKLEKIEETREKLEEIRKKSGEKLTELEEKLTKLEEKLTKLEEKRKELEETRKELEETLKGNEVGCHMLNTDNKEINQFGIDAKNKNQNKSPLLESLLSHSVTASLRTIGFSHSKEFHNEMEGGVFIRLSDFLEDLGLGDREDLSWFGEENQLTIFLNKGKYQFSCANKFEGDFVLWKSFFHMMESMETNETKEMLADLDIEDRFNSMLKSLLIKNKWMPKDLGCKLMEYENELVKEIGKLLEKLRELEGRSHSTFEMRELDKKLEKAESLLKNVRILRT
jgi:hypothetical protein